MFLKWRLLFFFLRTVIFKRDEKKQAPVDLNWLTPFQIELELFDQTKNSTTRMFLSGKGQKGDGLVALSL